MVGQDQLITENYVEQKVVWIDLGVYNRRRTTVVVAPEQSEGVILLDKIF